MRVAPHTQLIQPLSDGHLRFSPSPDGEFVLRQPYFPTDTPLRYDQGTTYADDTVRLGNATTFEWQHSLAEIVQALLRAGLTLTSLAEHRSIPWRALPQMVPTPQGWTLPERGECLPLTFSLTATKPEQPATADQRR